LRRDVAVHLQNEQPLLADLVVEPARADTDVICRNPRTMNGKKLDFVDRSIPRSSFPQPTAGFVEVHRATIDALRDEKAARTEAGAGAAVSIEAAGPEELDDDLLHRIRDV
jgi:hypothetical protein